MSSMKEQRIIVLWKMKFYFKGLKFMDNKQLYLEWFEFAKRDLESAKFLINMYPKTLEIICYHCEERAENIQSFITRIVK